MACRDRCKHQATAVPPPQLPVLHDTGTQSHSVRVYTICPAYFIVIAHTLQGCPQGSQPQIGDVFLTRNANRCRAGGNAERCLRQPSGSCVIYQHTKYDRQK